LIVQKAATIGIIGGMGPDATNRLCELITLLTPARTDQAHIPVITFNNSAIPSRVDALFHGGPSPLPELIRTARILEAAGADFLLMPCNTAHIYLEELQLAVTVPIVNMIEATVRHAIERYPRVDSVGVLGSTPTLKTGLYHKCFAKFGRSVVVPDEVVQIEMVMASIFGDNGIKAGRREQPKADLLRAGMHLHEKGAQVVIAGCTEISLVLTTAKTPFEIIDPLEVLANLAVDRALVGERSPVKAAMHLVKA
jgi:aspartate racemase